VVDFRVSGTASLDPDKIIESVDMIIEKLDELRDKVDEIDMTIDRLSGKTIDIGVNIDGEDKLIFLRDLLDDLDARDYHVNIKVDIDGEDKIEALKLELDDLDAKDHKVKLDIDVKGIAGATEELIALDEELNHKEEDFKKAEKSSKDFQFSIMALLPVLTAVIPILAAAGGGAVALAGAFAMMAPGIIGVALAAKPAFTAIEQMSKKLDQNTKDAIANAKGYDQIYGILQKNSKLFQQMSPELQDLAVKWFQFQNAYSAFQKAVDPAVFPLLGAGLSILSKLLSGLVVPTRAAAAALQNMLEDFSSRLHDPVFHTFFENLKKDTYTLVSDWSEGVLNIIEGITAIINAFTPLTLNVSGGFLRMTQSFDQWAQKLATSKGFQDFVSYVQTNGPIVLNIIGQLVQLLAHIGAALSGMGGGSLQIIDKLLQGLNHLATTNPALFKLVTTVALLGFAMSKLLPLIGPIVEFLMTPVGAIVAVLIAVGAGFIYAYEHSKTFRDWVQKNIMPMWNDIVNAAKGFITWIKGLWPDIIQIWDKYGKTFLALVKNLWDFVGNIFQAALKVIKGIVDILVGLLTGDWNRVRDGIEAIVSGLWQAVESFFRDGVKIIGDILSGLGEILYNIGKSIIQGLWNGMKDVWNSVTGWLGDIGGWISDLKGPIEKDATLLTPHGKVIIKGLMNGMQSQMPAMATQLKGFGKTIEDAFGSSYSTDISAKVRSSLGDASYNLANYQQGGKLPAANSTQMHFAAGAFVIQGGKSEKPSDTITRVLQGAAKFGSIQSPVGYSINQ
jgi:phage-related protein